MLRGSACTCDWGGYFVDLVLHGKLIERKRDRMDVELILKVCGVAMVVTFICNLMSKAGKDEQSAMVSLLGVVLILIILAEKIGVLVGTLKEVFGL